MQKYHTRSIKVNARVKLTRRQFLTLSAGTIGATVLACSGFAILGTKQPAIEFVAWFRTLGS